MKSPLVSRHEKPGRRERTTRKQAKVAGGTLGSKGIITHTGTKPMAPMTSAAPAMGRRWMRSATKMRTARATPTIGRTMNRVLAKDIVPPLFCHDRGDVTAVESVVGRWFVGVRPAGRQAATGPL